MFIFPLMLALFTWENQEFFVTAKEQLKDGHEWEYVGKEIRTENVPALPLIVHDGVLSDELIYWKLKK